MNIYDVYEEDLPDIIIEALNCPQLQRIGKVGMNCGCEYTNLPLFNKLDSYSRLDHSIGVGLIAYHFSKDNRQILAGLFHDIATPVFAHVIDFLNNDHLSQSSTEEKTADIIAESKEIRQLLGKYQLSVGEVSDYHLYPICDNDTPKLSSDRLEYSLGNMYNFHFASKEEIKAYFDDLVIGINEFGETELMFQSEQLAVSFTQQVLRCSKVYSGDEDRLSMEYLAQVLKKVIALKVISYDDLYKDEPFVINKIINNPETKILWEDFRRIRAVKRVDSYQPGAIKVDAKKRYIDPYVINKGRVSNLNSEVKKKMDEFIHYSYDYYLVPIRD